MSNKNFINANDIIAKWLSDRMIKPHGCITFKGGFRKGFVPKGELLCRSTDGGRGERSGKRKLLKRNKML